MVHPPFKYYKVIACWTDGTKNAAKKLKSSCVFDRLNITWKEKGYRRATAGRTKLHPYLVTDWVLSQFISERKIAEAGYRRFVRDGIGIGSIWNSVRAQSVFGENDFVESVSDYARGRKQVPEIAKSQRFMNKPPLRDIFRSEVLRETEKRQDHRRGSL